MIFSVVKGVRFRMDNPYKLKPFKLHVLNIGKEPTIYIFLGNVPPAVLNAANSFKKTNQGFKWDNNRI